MKTYTIKQPIFELWEGYDCGEKWYSPNVDECLYIYFEQDNSLPYLATYFFESSYDEDTLRFKTFDEAKEWLIDKFTKYVTRNLDEVE